MSPLERATHLQALAQAPAQGGMSRTSCSANDAAACSPNQQRLAASISRLCSKATSAIPGRRHVSLRDAPMPGRLNCSYFDECDPCPVAIGRPPTRWRLRHASRQRVARSVQAHRAHLPRGTLEAPWKVHGRGPRLWVSRPPPCEDAETVNDGASREFGT
jgi:hypothetical protein